MFGFGIAVGIIGIGVLIWAIWRITQGKAPIGFIRVLSIFVSIVIIGGGVALSYIGFHSESFKRWQKDLKSNYEGGLERRITVVDKDGEVLKEYEGRMDIQSTDGDKLVFVMDGKKYIIYNRNIFNTIFVEEL